MIYNNVLKAVNDSKLTADKKIEILAENLASVSSEIELHQNELYFIKKGIILKSNAYYKDANPKIKADLIIAFREMEWALVVADVTAFCNAIYRQLEIFSNYVLFDHLKFNDNLVLSGTKFIAGPNHFLNKLNGCFINESRSEKFIDFSIAADKAYMDRYYLGAESRKENGKQVGYLRINFANKMNLLYGIFFNSEIENKADGKKYKYLYNHSFKLTNILKDIRDAREHGLQSKHLINWEARHYFDSIKLVHDIYFGIKDLRI